MGDNSWIKSIRVVILARDTPTQCRLQPDKVSWKNLKGYRSYGPRKVSSTDGRTDGRQGDRYIPRTFRSGDKKEKMVWFCRSLILFHIPENKYEKYNLIDRYHPISPSNHTLNINFINVQKKHSPSCPLIRQPIKTFFFFSNYWVEHTFQHLLKCSLQGF